MSTFQIDRGGMQVVCDATVSVARYGDDDPGAPLVPDWGARLPLVGAAVQHAVPARGRTGLGHCHVYVSAEPRFGCPPWQLWCAAASLVP